MNMPFDKYTVRVTSLGLSQMTLSPSGSQCWLTQAERIYPQTEIQYGIIHQIRN